MTHTISELAFVSASFTQPRLFSTFSAYHTRPFPLLKVSFYLQYASLCARPYLVYIARLLKSGLPKIQLPSFSPPRQLCHQGLVLATIASWHRWNLSFNHCCRASIQILRVNLAMLIDYAPMLFLGYGPKRVSQQHFGWYMRRTSIMGTSGTCYD